MPKLLTKSLFTAWRDFPKSAWWRFNDPKRWAEVSGFSDDAPGKAELGKAVEDLVRQKLEAELGVAALDLFPDAPTGQDWIDGDEDWAQNGDFADRIEANAARTLTALRDGAPLLYQPGFLCGDLYARADFLAKEPDGSYRLIEAKAKNGVRATVSNKGADHDAGDVRDEFLNDVGFQRYVVEKALRESGVSVKISRWALAHLNADYVRGESVDPAGILLFEELDRASSVVLHGNGTKWTKKVDRLDRLPHAATVEKEVAEMRAQLPLSEPRFNAAYPFDGTKCREWFGVPERPFGTIYGPGLDNSAVEVAALHRLGITDLPSLHPQAIERLAPRARESVKKFLEAQKSGGKIVDAEKIRAFLADLPGPICFYDYETVSLPVPPFLGTRPYQQVVVQYSLHVLHPDGRLEHSGAVLEKYAEAASVRDVALEPAGETCGRNVAVTGTPRDIVARFLDDVRPHLGAAAFVVWNKSFENSRNREMAADWPEFSAELLKVNFGTVDLMDPFRDGAWYDLGFRGSCSIKKVLPVLVPGMTYAGLPVADGGKAMAALARLARGTVADSEREKSARDLLAYCRQDSLATVKIFQKMREEVS